MNSIATLLAQGSQYLQEKQIDDTLRCARLLLAYVLEMDSTQILSSQTNTVHDDQEKKFWDLLHRRADHEPIDYILTTRPFRGLELNVNQYTLIPRSETEQLVELVLDYVAKNRPVDQIKPLRIADIGTGSGAIAVSLAYHLHKRNYNVHVYATDTSAAALAVAQENAAKYRLEERITFLRTDLLHPVDGKNIPACDIVVANLPYVPRERIATLEPEVRDHEPILALDGGEDGLDLYRALLEQLTTIGWAPEAVFFEIDETHGSAISTLLRQYNSDTTTSIQIIPDLNGMDRFAFLAP
jgi:release factor glutamine methyltransferase